MDDRIFRCINGDLDLEILLNRKFDKVFFSGNSVMGKKVAAAAAKQLTPVTTF